MSFTDDPFKESLRELLLTAARSRKRISYAELASKIGHEVTSDELDAIAAADAAAGRPDVTLVAIDKKTGYPKRFAGRDFNSRSLDDLKAYTTALKAAQQFYGMDTSHIPKPVWK